MFKTVWHLLLYLTLIPPLYSQKVVDVWGGARYSLALKSDSTVWDWGSNGFGHAGDGDTSTGSRTLPVEVHGPNNIGFLTSIKAIMGGETHSIALKSDGTVWCWGWNAFGQLGNNDPSIIESAVPVQVTGANGVGFLDSVVALGGRGYHSLAIKADGTVWTWGWNSLGELGNNDPAHATSYYPVEVSGLTEKAVMVTGGYKFSVALMADSTVRSWGANGHGELGANSSATSSDVPLTVYGLSNIVQVSCGWKHALALRSDSTVWVWGDNSCGELGNGNHGDYSIVPVQVPGLTSVISVSGGDGSSLALKADGTVWKWGLADTVSPQTGPYPSDRLAPVQISQATGMTNVVIARARDYHNLAITADGSVWAWGDNLLGQLGNGTLGGVQNGPSMVSFGTTSVLFPTGIYSFAANSIGNTVKIEWETVGEVNGHGFELQRSGVDPDSPGRYWGTIAFFESTGTSNVPEKFSYGDSNIAYGRYSYRLKQVNNYGSFKYSTEVEVEVGRAPTSPELSQNYPNPFNPTTTIRYELPATSRVSLRVFDLLGRQVAELVNGTKRAGAYSVTWNAASLPSGVYVYRLTTDGSASTRKLLLLK